MIRDPDRRDALRAIIAREHTIVRVGGVAGRAGWAVYGFLLADHLDSRGCRGIPRSPVRA